MSTPPTTSTGRPLVARRMNASEQLRAEKKSRQLVQLLIGLATKPERLPCRVEVTTA